MAFLDFILFSCSEMKIVEYKYFSSGENVTLKCKSQALYWTGPAVNTMEPINETTFVEMTDNYDKRKKWHISIYTKGDTVKDTLPQNLFKRLHLIGDNFDLLITNLSASDEGLYICDPRNNAQLQKLYILQNICKYTLFLNLSNM